MSMILDALKRSQSDARDSSSQPVIDQSYSSLTSSAPRCGFFWLAQH